MTLQPRVEHQGPPRHQGQAPGRQWYHPLPLASVPVACVGRAISVLMSALHIAHGRQANNSSQLVPFFTAWQELILKQDQWAGACSGRSVHGESPVGEFEHIEMARVQA